MSLINLTLTNYTIQPLLSDYTNSFNERVIDSHIIFCDISGSDITDNSFNLNIFPENKENSIQKFNVLFRNNKKGRLIFGQLFKNRTPQKIFAFLDEKSTIWQDLSIIMACPKKEFVQAFIRRVFLI